MKKDIEILINSKTSKVTLPTDIIGLNRENLQGKLIFKFEDEFVDGIARIEISKNREKSYIGATKVEETYVVPILNSLLTTDTIDMQLVITESEVEKSIPIFKSKVFYLKVLYSINAEIEEPEEYPQWIDEANQKLNEMDNVDIDIERQEENTKVTITRKDGTKKEVIVSGGGSSYDDTEVRRLIKVNADAILKLDKDKVSISDLKDYVVDKDYVHTDNNYTNTDKNKLANLENYDDTELRNRITNAEDDIDNLETTVAKHTNQIENIEKNKADRSEIPTVGNGTITIKQGGNTKGTFTTNQSKNTTIELENYDDTELKDKITNVENDIDDLETIVTKHTNDINKKQDQLINGENIKTINNQSILGSGNVHIEVGTSDYNDLNNKPKINNVVLEGNKSLEDLGIDQDFVKDNDYVHTDNNYTTSEKDKLSNLENYDDTELKDKITNVENDIDDLETTVTRHTNEIANKQPKGNYIEDLNYVHTDNNFTNEEKHKLSILENYDDTELKNRITNAENDIDDLETTTNELDKRISFLEGKFPIETLTWDNIQELVQKRLVQNYFEIGDQFVTKWKDTATNIEYEVPLDIVAFRDVTIEENGEEKVVPGMILQWHYATPFGVQLSQNQAFKYAKDIILAGTYYFTIDTDWGECIKGKSYQFTLTKDIPIGGQIQIGLANSEIGACSDQKPKNWRIRTYADCNTVVPLEIVTLTEGTEGTFLGKLNGSRKYNEDELNNLYSSAYGHNRWKTSALRQFLNSDASSGAWWSNQGDVFDRIPNECANKNGFLSGVEEDLLNVIKPIKVNSAINTTRDSIFGVWDYTYDKFFLPSMEEAYCEPKIYGEGEYWDYWKEKSGTSSPNGQFKTNPNMITYAVANHSSPEAVRLRSCTISNCYSGWNIYTSGYISNGRFGYSTASTCFSPACVIC